MLNNKKINGVALTYDDVLILPAYSNILPRDVDLHTRFTKNISLNIPIVSAAMDRVTAVSYTHLRAHETVLDLVCRLLLEKTNNSSSISIKIHRTTHTTT